MTNCEGYATTRIPADVDRPDRVLFGLTGRQVALLAPVGAVLYVAWLLVGRWVSPLVFLPVAGLVGMLAVAVAVGQRDGLPLDRFLLAALGHRRAARVRVPAPEGLHAVPGWLAAMSSSRQPGLSAMELPARDVDGDGVLDLGPDGCAVLAGVATVNFGLRSAGEQQQLVGGFARWLHALTGPVQILVRAQRLDLTSEIAALRQRAAGPPDEALRRAAAEHAEFLAELAGRRDLYTRQVLLIARDAGTGSDPAGGRLRVVRELEQAARGLAAADLTVTPLDAEQAIGVLAAAFNPNAPTPTGPVAAPGSTVTTATTAVFNGGEEWEEQR